MASQADVIQKVRHRVADFNSKRIYADSYYIDAIEFGLSKLSFDFSETYTSVELIPISRVFLLVKIAAISMCQIRAADLADKDVESEGGDLSSITVPDLAVSRPSSSDAHGANFWLKLAKDLQDEYDGELAHDDDPSQYPEVQVGIARRVSLTTGGYAKRKLDPGLSAVLILASASGSDVSVSWDILYDITFQSYEVYRAKVSDMSDEARIAVISDNHEVTYVDEDVAPGTWYYRVKTVNPNAIKTPSNIETVVVV